MNSSYRLKGYSILFFALFAATVFGAVTLLVFHSWPLVVAAIVVVLVPMEGVRQYRSVAAVFGWPQTAESGGSNSYEAAQHLSETLRIPGIVDLHALESGGCTATLWVSLKKMYTGHVDQVAMAVLGYFGMSYYKWIIIADEDDDIRDPFMREWILSWRVAVLAEQLDGIAHGLREQADARQAQSGQEQVLELPTRLAMRARLGLARVAAAEGRTQEAIDMLRGTMDALERTSESGQQRSASTLLRAHVGLEVADLYSTVRAYRQAEDYYRQALDLLATLQQGLDAAR